MSNSRTVSSTILSFTLLAVGYGALVWDRKRNQVPEIKKNDETQSKATQTAKTSPTPVAKATPSADEAKESIRLVVQRFRQASLLVDGKVMSFGESCSMVDSPTEESSTSCGLVVYISFAAAATTEKALQAAKTIINLPLLTTGGWGDGSGTKSVLDMAKSDCKPYLLLVPQANLISKVKSQGKSIQYHGQIDKDVGKKLYNVFINYTRALVLQHQHEAQKKPVPKWVASILETKKSVEASVPPQEMFRDITLYSAWDAEGIPSKDAQGGDLTRSAMKKMRKQYESQKKRHEKYRETAGAKGPTKGDAEDWSLLDPSFCTVVGSTFGARQGLEVSSDMGPFCHTVSL